MTESCGKCIPCRAGTHQMHGLLDKIAEGRATPADLALLEELCEVVQATSLCGLGQTAPNPVLSTLRYFRHEYLERLRPDPLATLPIVGTHSASATSATSATTATTATKEGN